MEPEERLDEKGYTYLGWANGWSDLPAQVKNCDHTLKHTQHCPRGANNTVQCDECKWYYKVDSSG